MHSCIPKITTKSVGTTESIRTYESNLSLTICISDIQDITKIRKPNIIRFQEKGRNWTVVSQYASGNVIVDNVHNRFISKTSDDILQSCESYLIKGDILEIHHRYYVTSRKLDIFIHETGLFHTDFKLRVLKENFLKDTSLIMNIERFVKINDGSCADKTDFDFNINRKIKTEMLQLYGCVFQKLK